MSKVKHTFKYVKADRYKRPIIPVVLKYKNKEIKYLALIDSGADLNIFHADLATLLGVDVSKLKEVEFGGIKQDPQPCKGWLAVLQIGVDDEIFDSAVIFSNDISNNGYGILGQNGFFDHYRIVLDYQTDQIILKRSKK